MKHAKLTDGTDGLHSMLLAWYHWSSTQFHISNRQFEIVDVKLCSKLIFLIKTGLQIMKLFIFLNFRISEYQILQSGMS